MVKNDENGVSIVAKKKDGENRVFDLAFFQKQGALGGKKGGGLSWKKLTPEERSARAGESSRKRPSVKAKAARLAKAAKVKAKAEQADPRTVTVKRKRPSKKQAT